MMIKRTKDSRTTQEKRRDDDVQRAIEAGTFSHLTTAQRVQLRERARLKKAARQAAEAVGLEVGELRRRAGLTQAAVAELISTQRTDITRLESGRYGGLTVDRLIALMTAIKQASGMTWQEILPVMGGQRVYEFQTVADTLESGGRQ